MPVKKGTKKIAAPSKQLDDRDVVEDHCPVKAEESVKKKRKEEGMIGGMDVMVMYSREQRSYACVDAFTGASCTRSAGDVAHNPAAPLSPVSVVDIMPSEVPDPSTDSSELAMLSAQGSCEESDDSIDRHRESTEISVQPAEDIPYECMTVSGRAISSTSLNIHSDRRVMGAAATVAGAAGMILVGPLSGVAFGAAAAYATTREDTAGTAARRAGAAYVKVADWATDACIKVADLAVEEGCRKLSEELRSANINKVPAPLRAGLEHLSRGMRPVAEEMDAETIAEARRLRQQHPERVPVICERSPYSDLPQIERKKFAVPGTMLFGEFKYIVHKQVMLAMGGNIGSERTIYVFVNGASMKTSTRMAEIYEQHCSDGFLLVKYSAENTLG